MLEALGEDVKEEEIVEGMETEEVEEGEEAEEEPEYDEHVWLSLRNTAKLCGIPARVHSRWVRSFGVSCAIWWDKIFSLCVQ